MTSLNYVRVSVGSQTEGGGKLTGAIASVQLKFRSLSRRYLDIENADGSLDDFVDGLYRREIVSRKTRVCQRSDEKVN